MEGNKLNIYLDEIGHRPLLTAEEEARLSSLIAQGNERALDRLVESNLRLVVSQAGRLQGRGLSIDDLVSEGNIGLIKAARRFDARRGLRFAGYALPIVRRQMELALRRESAQMRVENTAAGVSRSVDAPLGSKTGVSLLSVLVNDNSPQADERTYSANTAAAVERAIASLDERERRVVNACFGIDQDAVTMIEAAQEMGLKRERVRQIRNKAIRKMRKAYRAYLRQL